MDLISVYQEAAKASIRTGLNLQKAADKITEHFIGEAIVSNDANGNAIKEYVHNFYQTRQELLNKMAETAEKAVVDYPFKKEITEFNQSMTENSKKFFELFTLPLMVNTTKK